MKKKLAGLNNFTANIYRVLKKELTNYIQSLKKINKRKKRRGYIGIHVMKLILY